MTYAVRIEPVHRDHETFWLVRTYRDGRQDSRYDSPWFSRRVDALLFGIGVLGGIRLHGPANRPLTLEVAA